MAAYTQLKPDDIVQVELNAEDLALTSAEAKDTYEEIKTYVKRAFGFKVSSLHIAQVKQKMGLPTDKNYNVISFPEVSMQGLLLGADSEQILYLKP